MVLRDRVMVTPVMELIRRRSRRKMEQEPAKTQVQVQGQCAGLGDMHRQNIRTESYDYVPSSATQTLRACPLFPLF